VAPSSSGARERARFGTSRTPYAYSIPDELGTLTPAQWGRSPHLLARRGEARLGAAVLREAWQSLRLPSESRVYRDAVAFFLEPATGTEAVSFELACTLAGVDPDHVRRAVWARRLARTIRRG
jgi:hypothetical protein